MKLFLAFILLTFISTDMNAQDLSDYRWKNRILLLLADEIDQKDLENQISEIRESHAEVDDRKLVVFLITKDRSYMGFTLDTMRHNKGLYENYKVTTAPFEMVLIGLDGGVKKRYSEYQPLINIFALIDGMPMRRSEIRKKGE